MKTHLGKISGLNISHINCLNLDLINHNMRFFKHVALALLTAGFISANATTEIPLSISTGPGGSYHKYAIAMQPLLREWLHQTVVVEFKPGGNGVVAAHALVANPNPAFLISGVQKDLPVDQLTDMIPVLYLGAQIQVLFVNSDLGITDVRQIFNNKRTWNYGVTNGNPVSHNMARYSSALSNQTTLQEVLYKSSVDVLRDVIGKHIDMGINSTTTVARAAKEGRVTVLATLGPQRSLLMPQIPTLTEYGYAWANDVYQGQTVLWASPATSRASIDLVRKNFQKWLATKDSQELLKNIDHRLAVESAMWPEKVINSIVRK